MGSPIVSTLNGKVQGKWISKGEIASFKGIPFAQPPVGELRWKRPQHMENWEGIKRTTKFGPHAWQQEITLPLFLGALVNGQGWSRLHRFFVNSLLKIVPKPRQSEDCLYLNIKSPQLDSNAKLPVMVWIHGGDHQDGGAADIYYDGTALPEAGVVLVTINYRLGLMGYFAHPDLKKENTEGVSGNYGTLDQIAALQWVQNNISKFGGDPNNVTIFGESAGGESVLHMLTSPLARGLFHKAVMQSPGNTGQMIHLDKQIDYIPSAEAQSLGYSDSMGVGAIDDLRSLSAEELMSHLRKEATYNVFYPNIDGYVLLQSPLETFRNNQQANVPLLIGSNSDEGTCLYPIFNTPIVDYRHLDLSRGDLMIQLREDFGDDTDRLLNLYPGLEQGEGNAVVSLFGDDLFTSKVRYYADCATKNNQPVFLYFFKRRPPSPTQTAGAFHASEVPFVHGTNTPILPLKEKDIALSKIMIRHWTNFAKSGNPNGSEEPEWNTFDDANPKWMEFDINTVGMNSIDRDENYQILIKRMLSRIDRMKKNT